MTTPGNYINPTLQKVNPPSLTILLDAIKREVKKDINCVKIGVIQAFDPDTQEVTVMVAQQQVTSIAQTGARTLAAYPLLLRVPVQFPSGGGFTLTFPIAAGDECIILFNDRELDNWLINGPGFAPTSGRVHDLSDGIAIVGVRSNPRALSGVSTGSTQLRSDDGATYIDVAPGKIQIVADEVVIHGNLKTAFDAGGTGFVYTPDQITNYTDGVPSSDNAPHPPEVPT